MQHIVGGQPLDHERKQNGAATDDEGAGERDGQEGDGTEAANFVLERSWKHRWSSKERGNSGLCSL